MVQAGTMVSPASQRGPTGPQGIAGPAGPPGPQGASGTSAYSITTQPFAVPTKGQTAVCFVQAAVSFGVGQIVYVANGDYMSVQAVSTANNTITLQNMGILGTAAGTNIPVGSTVSGTGPQGPQGIPGPTGPTGPQGLVGLAPTGAIFLWPATTAPGGYLICDGTAYSQTGYSALFSIISTSYNTAAGATDPGPGMFRVPNFQGRVALGTGQSNAAGATAHALASTGGEETHVLVLAELASHKHNVTDSGHAHVIPAHGHGWNDNNHAHISPSHGHGFYDPSHSHVIDLYTSNFTVQGVNRAESPGGSANYTRGTRGAGTGCSVYNSGDFWINGNLTNWGAVGSVAAQPAFWDQTNYANVSEDYQGGSAGHNTLPPYVAVNYIIKT
jgi:microcystin-dependent protein